MYEVPVDIDYEMVEPDESHTSTPPDYDDITNQHPDATDLVIGNPQLQVESQNYELPLRRNRDIYNSIMSDDSLFLGLPYEESGGTLSVCMHG